MDSRSILKEQIEELQGRLDRINKVITSPTAGSAGIEERLLDRVRLRFEKRILDQDKALDYARQCVLDPTFDLAECWDLFRSAQRTCQPLMEESLAVLEGALARSARLDDGICNVADRLIAEIGKLAENDWNRFTIPSEGELYTNIADVIRVRFPSAGIWDLPVVAHEYGHFVSKRLSEEDPTGAIRHPFQDYLVAKNAAPDSRIWHHLNEFFADAFAAYAVGPAYALTALLLRFDASDEDGDTHPSPAKRAYLILKTLKWMDQRSLLAPFSGLIDILTKLWPPPPDSNTCFTIDDYLDDWLDPMLEKNLPFARYRTEALPHSLASKLRQQAKAEDGHSLRDVLNAAWLARIDTPESKKTIEQTAAGWCMGPSVGAPIRLVAHG